MRTRLVQCILALLVIALVASACGDDDSDSTPADGTATESQSDADAAAPSDRGEAADGADAQGEADAAMDDGPGTIVDVAVANGSFTTLVAAVQAADLVETLSGDGPFTVFAPTDDAFAAALDALGMTADELLADTDLLTSVLTYHVIAGEVPAAEVVTMNGQSATTVNGADVDILVDGDTVMVNDAIVTAVDVEASNGVIHVIDAVLLPPS